jgi:dTDP-4-dehydrorhamnose 3,5-epimerase
MQVSETKLPGILLIEPKVYPDSRGYFFEMFNQANYDKHGINKHFVQDNISRSSKNVLRGLHYQLEKPQAKLVSVLQGSVYDVVVDIRKNSPTFGQWFGVELNDKNHLQLFIPEGFAHGFYVLSQEVYFFYKCSDYYHPPSEQGIRWDDPDLGINWGAVDPIVSEKDKNYKSLKQVPDELLLTYNTSK